MSNNEIIVKKPEEIITARMKLNESELKLSTYLIANLEPDKYIYRIDIKNYIKRFDKKLGDYSKLYKTAKFLVTKPIEIKDRYKDQFVMFSFCSKVSYKSGVLEIEFNKELLNYLLEIKNKYVRYDIKNIMKLNSKYSIRLYEFLKNQFEKTKKFSKVAEKKVKTEELRELLSIPASYKYNMFKKTALEVSKRQINQLTDISFDYEEIKTGRKITHIKFIIENKEKENSQDNNILQEKNNTKTKTKNQLPAPTQNKKLEILKQKIKTNEIKSLKELSAYLQKLKNVNITNAIYDENFYFLTFKLIRINEFGMIELDGEEVDRETANYIRRILYQNPDLIGKFVNIDNELEELKDKFINKIWIFTQNGFYNAVGVKDIIRENKNVVKVTGIELLREKDFEIKVTIDFLKTQSSKDKLSLADKDYYIQFNYIREKEMQEQAKEEGIIWQNKSFCK